MCTDPTCPEVNLISTILDSLGIRNTTEEELIKFPGTDIDICVCCSRRVCLRYRGACLYGIELDGCEAEDPSSLDEEQSSKIEGLIKKVLNELSYYKYA